MERVSILELPARFNDDLIRHCPANESLRINPTNTWFVAREGGLTMSEYEQDSHFHRLLRPLAEPLSNSSRLALVPFYFVRRAGCLTDVSQLRSLLADFAAIMERAFADFPSVTFFTVAPGACSCRYSCNPLAGTPMAQRLRVLSWEADLRREPNVRTSHRTPHRPLP